MDSSWQCKICDRGEGGDQLGFGALIFDFIVTLVKMSTHKNIGIIISTLFLLHIAVFGF